MPVFIFFFFFFHASVCYDNLSHWIQRTKKFSWNVWLSARDSRLKQSDRISTDGTAVLLRYHMWWEWEFHFIRFVLLCPFSVDWISYARSIFFSLSLTRKKEVNDILMALIKFHISFVEEFLFYQSSFIDWSFLHARALIDRIE